MDAIDAALINIDEKEKLTVVNYIQCFYPEDLRGIIRGLSANSTLNDISKMDIKLGYVFADAALEVIKQSRIKAGDIHAIGHHGQTIFHLPDEKEKRTLQIGDANTIAYKTGIMTIADFRRMDMAAGGQGAPLTPAFHAWQFRTDHANRIILNIGGIANITVLPADKNLAVRGFDTGPGNGLLDDWIHLHLDMAMDKNGQWASTGVVDSDLLELLMADPYFSLATPKSTGRDYFNLNWLNILLQQFNKTITAQDVQATLLELTVNSISNAINTSAPDTTEVYVCGGGAHNKTMMDRLKLLMQEKEIASTEKLGINPDAVEAIAFAWLAHCRINNIPVQLKTITGAEKDILLGAVYACY